MPRKSFELFGKHDAKMGDLPLNVSFKMGDPMAPKLLYFRKLDYSEDLVKGSIMTTPWDKIRKSMPAPKRTFSMSSLLHTNRYDVTDTAPSTKLIPKENKLVKQTSTSSGVSSSSTASKTSYDSFNKLKWGKARSIKNLLNFNSKSWLSKRGLRTAKSEVEIRK